MLAPKLNPVEGCWAGGPCGGFEAPKVKVPEEELCACVGAAAKPGAAVGAVLLPNANTLEPLPKAGLEGVPNVGAAEAAGPPKLKGVGAALLAGGADAPKENG